MRRSGAGGAKTGQQRGLAHAANTKFRKMRVKMNKPKDDVLPLKQTKYTSYALPHSSSSSTSDDSSSPPSLGDQEFLQATNTSTADIFDFLLSARNPGPMWQQPYIVPPDDGGEEGDDYPTYADEYRTAAEKAQAEEKRKYLHSVRLLSDVVEQSEGTEEDGTSNGSDESRFSRTAAAIVSNLSSVPSSSSIHLQYGFCFSYIHIIICKRKCRPPREA